MDEIRPIRSDDDLDWALRQIERYFDNPPQAGSPEEDRYDILNSLISEYESRLHAIDALDPIETIATYMNEAGLTQSDLATLVGSRSRASEFLNYHRPLSLAAIRKIAGQWRLPIADLAAPYTPRLRRA